MLADRGPLDGLVAYDPAPDGLLARRFLRSAGRCDLALLLEAEPDVLLARDPDHTRAGLEETGRRYRRWAGALGPPLVRLRSGPAPRSTADEALRLVRERLPGPGPGPVTARPRVVLSVFDDPGDAEQPGVVVGKVARRLAEECDMHRRHGGSPPAAPAPGAARFRSAGRRAARCSGAAAARRPPSRPVRLESLAPPAARRLFTRAPVVGIGPGPGARAAARRSPSWSGSACAGTAPWSVPDDAARRPCGASAAGRTSR
ncbi:hypothetical protein [Streptomyces sp. KL110A]|uniref:hypothetical protein n=1 Tax=Streptomyces sp. KL110A TaxID=3384221 RepID=UPI0038C7F748